jgi:hypothetical protein
MCLLGRSSAVDALQAFLYIYYSGYASEGLLEETSALDGLEKENEKVR